MTSLVTDGIFGPTVPSYSLQQLKIGIKPPVVLASLFHGPMTFWNSFWLRYCFEASSEPDLGPLTYNSSSTEVPKSSHEHSDAVVAGLWPAGDTRMSRRFFWGGPIRCTIVSHYVQQFFPRKAKNFSRGLVLPILTVLFSRTKKELCAFAISCKNKSFLYIGQVLKIIMNIAI